MRDPSAAADGAHPIHAPDASISGIDLDPSSSPLAEIIPPMNILQDEHLSGIINAAQKKLTLNSTARSSSNRKCFMDELI